ncbi:MAG: phosphatase PAP2 family protein [Pseudomonadota bacterium]|jgi:undecaprenyl-diphosphatase
MSPRARELHWCVHLNRWGGRRRVQRLFAVVSRLGDGYVWYALIGLLPLLGGVDGAQASLHLAAVALVSLALYGRLKRWTRRPRPFASHTAITAWVAPLDEFSFPSGHTLHAVAFTLVACWYFPWLALMLVPFAVAVALSRVVLGLHYPSDVLAATVIGCVLALASIELVALL